MEIKEIFENRIKIEPKVMSIESLFNNPERVKNTDYKPFYQRNYVWDDEKATYFIESILLGTEIPPLIYFRNSDKVEIVDGRQRYETILRFCNSEFKLRKNGLQKLDNIGIANKAFKDLDTQLQDLFWDTKLRIIEFSFHSQNVIDEENEDLVKKEIFKRYNSGITPLKPTEIDNAVYFDDDLNSFFKRKLANDKILFRDVSSIFHFEKTSLEVILKKIRQLLVQHKIPIKYYAVKKDTVISKFYEFSFDDLEEAEIQNIYNAFIEKINLVKKIKSKFRDKVMFNRLISEGLIWAFSIMENAELVLKDVMTDDVIDELVNYILVNISAFTMDRSSFAKELYNRYLITSVYFANKFNIDFDVFLHYNAEFKQTNKDITPGAEERISFDDLRINKPEPSSIAIVDIVRQMSRQRFLIRPPYQRNEVINKKKSSAIIESILLGIKLPPIFVYKREDQISEVLDGQQRLLSILGFIEESYLDEKNKMSQSIKHGFALNLKNGILKQLSGKKFEQLSQEQKEKIKNFDLWIIEINYKNNINFEPIDLFIRLNNKPYPIKEDTFEMWNSYVSRDIIDTIKGIHKNHSGWFYIRKNNSRMENENIYTTLAYFQYSWNQLSKADVYAPHEVDIYKVVNKIYFRVRSKNEITKVLEDTEQKNEFINAVNQLEFNFIKKLRVLLSNDRDHSIITLNKNLDEIFMIENGRRTQQGFYALWVFLFDIPLEAIRKNNLTIRAGLKSLISNMSFVENKQVFDSNVMLFKNQFSITGPDNEVETNQQYDYAHIREIGEVIAGIAPNSQVRITTAHSKVAFPFIRKNELTNFSIKEDDIVYIDVNDLEDKEFFDSKVKLLISRNVQSRTRFNTGIYDGRLAFGANLIGLVVTRYGFLPKYVLCIISSRFIFHNYHKLINDRDEARFLTLAELRAINIPAISTVDQKPFAKMADYLINSKHNVQVSMFFERIIDAMVYELIFQTQFNDYGIKIKYYLSALADLSEYSNESRREQIEIAFNLLSAPSHEIGASLLKILNIPEVQVIEEL